MKRIFLMLAVVLIACGAVWAAPPTPTWSIWDNVNLGTFNAVGTQSTESRYSAGTFDSDVDNYMDPAFFSTIGLKNVFMFVGGFPSDGTGVDQTSVLTDKNTISVGFAKMLGENYLGIYYGGSLVSNAGGEKEMVADPGKDTTKSSTSWRNSLAVVFGLGSMGFRLDLFVDTTDDFTTLDGGLSRQTIKDAPAVAFSWGTVINDKLFPWVKVGYQFPYTEVFTTGNPNEKPSKKVTYSQNAALGFNAGAWYDVNDTVSVIGDLTIGAGFPTSWKGDVQSFNSTGFVPGYYSAGTWTAAVAPTPVATSDSGEKEWTAGGAFVADLSLTYIKTLTFGDVNVKLKPNVDAAFLTMSTNNSLSDDKSPSEDYFKLSAGIDIGAQYVFDKIALYTGFGLNIFEWNTYGHTGGKEKNRETAWTFSGLSWKDDYFIASSTNLGFGLTFTPIEGLILGTGINLGAIFDPVTMALSTAASEAASGYSIWNKTDLYLTISYKY